MKEKLVVALPPSIKQYLENKENEVKYYDENTGLPNPDYEKLTGKKNPLDGYDTSLLPQAYQPKLENRWLVTLPEWMEIPPYVIFKTQRPSSYIINKKLFGIDVGNGFKWNNITMEMRDPINSEITKQLLNIIHSDINPTFSYTLDILDPTGIVIEKWLISDCKLVGIEFGDLNYISDTVVIIKINIEIGDAILI